MSNTLDAGALHGRGGGDGGSLSFGEYALHERSQVWIDPGGPVLLAALRVQVESPDFPYRSQPLAHNFIFHS